MKLTKEQASAIQQAAWNLERTICLLDDAGLDHHTPGYLQIEEALGELEIELKNYELVSE